LTEDQDFLSKAVLKSGITFDLLENLSFPGEDVHFCIRAQAMGFSIWADSRFPIYALEDEWAEAAYFKTRPQTHPRRHGPQRKGLTVCTITRNEEENLPRMIRSIEKIADEVIVSDTGSTDRTREIAESMGAVVIPFPWRGNFAAARNSAIREASGRWVLSLDADEELAPESIGELHRLVNSGVLALYSLKIINWIRERSGSDALSQFMHRNMRLFPRIPGCGYEWPIHEQLTSSLVPIPRMLADVTLYHHGYMSPETRLKKSWRNLEILRKAVEDDPSNSFHWFNLAMSYEGLGKWQDALEAFLKSIDLSPARAPFKSILYVHTALNLNYLNRFREAIPYAEEALRIEPFFPDAHFVLGNALAGLGEYPKAIESYRKALETPAEIMARLEGSDVGVSTWKAYNQMGLVYTYMHDHGSAIRCFEKALEAPGPDARLLINAAASYLALGNASKAEEYYRQAMEMEPANPLPYHSLVNMFLARKDNDKAIKIMDLAAQRGIPGVRVSS
jgi:tetratricopeptide (TPR) repeat protein